MNDNRGNTPRLKNARPIYLDFTAFPKKDLIARCNLHIQCPQRRSCDNRHGDWLAAACGMTRAVQQNHVRDEYPFAPQGVHCPAFLMSLRVWALEVSISFYAAEIYYKTHLSAPTPDLLANGSFSLIVFFSFLSSKDGLMSEPRPHYCSDC